MMTLASPTGTTPVRCAMAIFVTSHLPRISPHSSNSFFSADDQGTTNTPVIPNLDVQRFEKMNEEEKASRRRVRAAQSSSSRGGFLIDGGRGARETLTMREGTSAMHAG